MPNIPDIKPEICLCYEDVINLLLSSIALQEIALSNIINSESEKLQYVIKRKDKCYSIKELIILNESIEKVLSEVGAIETLLVTKLKYINQIYNKKDKQYECEKFDECSDDFREDIDCNNCKKMEESICNKELEFEEENEYLKTKLKNNTYNQNDYYKNYNKIINMFNKIVGRGMNKIN